MAKSNGLLSKIGRAFLLQASLIGIAVLLSVYFAKIVLEEVLIKKAIQEEADFYWEQIKKDDNWHLPNTLNLSGYRSVADLPVEIRSMELDTPGFREFENDNLKLVIYTSVNDGRALYLLYNRGEVDSLATYYGLFPLAVVLIILYLTVWITFVFSRRALSPVTRLARYVNNIDFSTTDYRFSGPDIELYDANDEINVLAEAINDLGTRLVDFISRERNFTRDASHELRSPLTVIDMATEILLSDDLSESSRNNVERIRRASADMKELTEAFLLLARESDESLSMSEVCVNDVITEEIDRAMMLNKAKSIVINYNPSIELYVTASDKVVSVLVGNLIRNAFIYTDQGSIDIIINDDNIVIKDSGIGMTQQKVEEIFKPFKRGENAKVAGFGVGLTIVKRLCDRFNWNVSIDSEPGMGTSVTVTFPYSGSKH